MRRADNKRENDAGFVLIKNKIVLASTLIALMLSACAPAIKVQSAQLSPINATQQRARVVKALSVRLSMDYSREIKDGSVWRAVVKYTRPISLLKKAHWSDSSCPASPISPL
ncbi:MAG: hypothetical protein CPDRYMAC_1229 [uncultured Paraburkholderia sp.]|nr:MAG: hypothetical protein CPDRYDRY_1208 [uncultured Paraburkholderia sp.]CAH2916778.1 MAG: hypothetical protein CPDRYMAC_1229 [uncultured Paraburkholderia sp.]